MLAAAQHDPASIADFLRDVGPIIGLVGVALTLLVNGFRDERRRRRDSHARALEAVANYFEMPFMIRRRRHDELAAERVRLTERFADVQAELASCEAVIRADTDPKVRTAYATLVQVLRSTAGAEASRAWNADPITSDREMGMPDLNAALAPISTPRKTCEDAMARSTMSLVRRILT